MGDSIDLIVFVAPGPFGISSGEAILYLDANVFEIVDVVPGTLLGPQPLVGFKQIDQVQGTVKVAIARIGDTPLPSSEGQLAIVNALIKPNASLGEHEIRLEIALADHQFNSLGTQASGAKLVVAP